MSKKANKKLEACKPLVALDTNPAQLLNQKFVENVNKKLEATRLSMITLLGRSRYESSTIIKPKKKEKGK